MMFLARSHAQKPRRRRLARLREQWRCLWLSLYSGRRSGLASQVVLMERVRSAPLNLRASINSDLPQL